MKKFVSIIIVMMFAAPICFAKGGKGHHKEIFKQLGLSKEQKQQLDDMRKNKGADHKELKKKKKELRKSMNEAMMSDASETDLRSLHNQISSLQTQIKTKRFEKMLKIRKILTPEQRKTFFEMKRKMRKHKRHHD